MKKLIFLLLLIPIVGLAQEGGYRSLKTKSAKIIHSDLSGDNDSFIRLDNNGNEIKTFIDNATIYLDGDTLKTSAVGVDIATQTLSGTSPTWDISSGVNAIITISGNTTITLTNVSSGDSGNLTVINPSTLYTLNVNGYTNAISRAIGTVGNYTKINISGSSATDQFSFYYNGSRLIWNGSVQYITP